MTTAKVEEIVESFETLTTPEQIEALTKLLATLPPIWVEWLETEEITISVAIAEALKILRAALEQANTSPTWGQNAATLIESLNLGDYSDVGDSVDWIKKQREDQNARRLGHRDSEA
jgi:hypothetical protein